MDTWLATIIYGSIIYFTYKANIQIAELKERRISERPADWPWVSWQIYLIREAIKPKSINMPLGMWLVIIYFALGIITYSKIFSPCPKAFTSTEDLLSYSSISEGKGRFGFSIAEKLPFLI